MSHAYSFFLIAVLVYKLPSFWQDLSVKNTLLVGFLLALIVLIRPTNILFALLVLLYDIYSLQEFKNRIFLIFKNIKTLWLIPFVGIVMAIPQMMYWHYISGRWIINIYQEIHNASFTLWNKPELYRIFFDPCNGFLFYNPLMLFSLVGMAWMAFKNHRNGRLIGGIFLLAMYICASWSMWWFGHSFGYRPFIDYYPVMIFGLAFYIDELLKSKVIWFKYLNLFVFIFLTLINFRFVIAPYYWQVEPDGANIEDFWKVWHWVFDFSQWN